ncbi:MAG: ribose 5-phosphate isomerase B [Proteobacteria bacterium]|nr:ribose 5-phosphate isomerase B [Pseudomonadota bacterium]
MKFIIGSDHAGLALKAALKAALEDMGHSVEDAGPETTESTDYSRYALQVARAVSSGTYERGILICGTGLGMSMAANRVRGVRAALCHNEYMARMSRAHNDANVLCLGERVIGLGLALSILEAWVGTEFEGGRHQRRLDIFDQVNN